MYKFTNPILEEIQDTDRLLAKVYKKVATALAKKGNTEGRKNFLKKMFDTIKHSKSIKDEIEKNAREAEQSLTQWRPPEQYIDRSYLGVWPPDEAVSHVTIQNERGRQDKQPKDRATHSNGIHGLPS